MFSDTFEVFNTEKLIEISNCTKPDSIKSILNKPYGNYNDIPALISPNALPFLEEMAQKSVSITKQRFGNTMQIFIPMYISNVCYNNCTYCGFSITNKYKRITLTEKEIEKECRLLQKKGFQHILILTGEAPGKVDVPFIIKAVKIASSYFSSVGIEIQPLNKEEYKEIINAGCDSLTMYQETYHPEYYKKYHISGKKKHYKKRLNTPDEGGKAGFHKMNIGALLGLAPWQYEAVSLASHLNYLQTNYWKTKYGISFNRIQGAIGGFEPSFNISDKVLTQLICAFRICFPDINISLSTRESESIRNHLFKLGVTTISAESNTAPGGYSQKEDTKEQFEISDDRDLQEIKKILKKIDKDPIMKDWDKELTM